METLPNTFTLSQEIHLWYKSDFQIFDEFIEFLHVPIFFFQVTHIYSPRDGRLMTLLYDDRSHLIFAQIFPQKYYIATDLCGTPMMVFNQYREVVREIVRSPFGHIVYDSNPYLYLPIDFCGGLLDQVRASNFTNLVILGLLQTFI